MASIVSEAYDQVNAQNLEQFDTIKNVQNLEQSFQLEKQVNPDD
jgi:hypothetical protein